MFWRSIDANFATARLIPGANASRNSSLVPRCRQQQAACRATSLASPALSHCCLFPQFPCILYSGNYLGNLHSVRQKNGIMDMKEE